MQLVIYISSFWEFVGFDSQVLNYPSYGHSFSTADVNRAVVSYL